jgi:hypothetical protein
MKAACCFSIATACCCGGPHCRTADQRPEKEIVHVKIVGPDISENHDVAMAPASRLACAVLALQAIASIITSGFPDEGFPRGRWRSSGCVFQKNLHSTASSITNYAAHGGGVTRMTEAGRSKVFGAGKCFLFRSSR